MKDCITNIMDNREIKIGLVIMASGISKRYGSNKLIELLENKPLIRWVIDSSANLFDSRIVVTRTKEVYDLCKSLDTDCILHELPGRNDTIRLGLTKLAPDIDYCFFMQADQPLISRESIIKMLEKAATYPDKIVRAAYQSEFGSPMGFPKSLFNDLLSLPDGKGGNFVAKRNAHNILTIEVMNDFELWDVDTKEDFVRINDTLKKKK